MFPVQIILWEMSHAGILASFFLCIDLYKNVDQYIGSFVDRSGMCIIEVCKLGLSIC